MVSWANYGKDLVCWAGVEKWKIEVNLIYDCNLNPNSGTTQFNQSISFKMTKQHFLNVCLNVSFPISESLSFFSKSKLLKCPQKICFLLKKITARSRRKKKVFIFLGIRKNSVNICCISIYRIIMNIKYHDNSEIL